MVKETKKVEVPLPEKHPIEVESTKRVGDVRVLKTTKSPGDETKGKIALAARGNGKNVGDGPATVVDPKLPGVDV